MEFNAAHAKVAPRPKPKCIAKACKVKGMARTWLGDIDIWSLAAPMSIFSGLFPYTPSSIDLLPILW